tara:strand:+ start:45 stop:809 length:765 start_codon:yes stop_codon:yes gene_type:complete
MSVFKLLFQLNPSKLKIIPAERMSNSQWTQLSSFLDDVSKRIQSRKFDVTPSQLNYLKTQSQEVQKKADMIMERAKKIKEGTTKPSAEIIVPLNFGKAPKTNLKKVRDRVEADKRITQDLADNDQIDVKDIDDFANGGRVGFEAGGITSLGSAKDFIESTGDDELMDLYIDFLVTGDDTAMLEALSRKGYKTYAKGGVVGGKKDEEEEIEDDDPGMFDDLFDRMFGEYELEKLKKSGRKPNADGGLATLFAERG